MAQDSSRADFWDTRYRDGITPWDAGGVPPRLLEWLGKETPALRVLVPGCGSGYEVQAFAARGHDVLGIDFSEEAAKRSHVRKADFFRLDEPPYDVVYERTFLCALPRRCWPQWAGKMAQVVRPGGRLVGFFYLNDNERGPPFGIDRRGLEELRGKNFELMEDEIIPAEESVPVLAGREVWQVWKRRL